MKEGETMRIGGLITVRLGSSRLPRKAFLKVNGQEIISYLVRRVSYFCGEEMEFFFCTTDLPEDMEFDQLARKLGINVFHGHPSNILKRHLQCAKENHLDFIVNIDGDDILCNPHYLKEIATIASEGGFDVIKTEGLPFGTNSMGYFPKTIEKILGRTTQNMIETGWGKLITDPIQNKVRVLAAKKEEQLDAARLTLDYEEDFQFFDNVLCALMSNDVKVPQEEIIRYLKCNPQVQLINQHLNNIYWENLNQSFEREKNS